MKRDVVDLVGSDGHAVARGTDTVRVFRKAVVGRWLRAVALPVLAALVVFAVPQIRWRAVLVAEKALGLQPSLAWSELPVVLAADSGIRLPHLAYHRDPYTDIENPRQARDDIARGGRLFAQDCARCHGDPTVGGAAPALVGRPLKSGDSDWAVFRTIRGGIPGTPMAPAPLETNDIWRVVAHLRSLGPRSRSPQATVSSGIDAAAQAVEVTPEMLAQSGRYLGRWLLPSGSYDGHRFAPDWQINAGNVGTLRVRWIHQFGTADLHYETVPIVAGSMMFVTIPDGRVMALDAASGAKLWTFDRPLPADVKLCCTRANRGVSVMGSRVYVGTADAHLIALDAASGTLEWDRPVADYRQGYSITSAPLPVADMIVTGVACGEYPARGFVAAVDAATGKPRWTRQTIPDPGEPGHDTWGGDSWKVGGASTWVTGSYDPESNLIFWGVGNPAPDFDASARPGDNLYSNSVLAIDARDGRIAWHFQFTPGDDHDFDSGQTPVLLDDAASGGSGKQLIVANRNGFFYVLDRRSGRFVRAREFSRQTWAEGLTDAGRPIPIAHMHPSRSGVLVYPNIGGAVNYWPTTFSPDTGLYYVLANERGSVYFLDAGTPRAVPGRLYLGGGASSGTADEGYTAVRAIDPQSAAVRWEHRNRTYNDQPRGGLLSTAGGLVFGSDTSRLFALDARDGAELWSFDTGGQISAAPVTFRSQGRQIVAVASGQMLIAFDLAHAGEDRPR